MMKISKFELLPNEVIIECFEFIHIFHIYYSFDGLNNRFNKLIRNLALNLDFSYVRKGAVDNFCQTLLSFPEIKQRIYSLHLSNKETCGQIDTFLSNFAPNDLSRLQRLTLTYVEKENIIKLKSMLPLSTNLFFIDLIASQIDEDEIISVLSLSKLQKLSMLSLRSFLIHIQQPTIITHLTIFNCSLSQLQYQLFQYVPMLKYLNVEYLSKYNRSLNNLDKYDAIHLEKLIIGEFKYNFQDFSIFAKQILNIKSLTISTINNLTMINALHWQYLIQSSLPYLSTFKFKFGLKKSTNNIEICLKRMAFFQSQFWIKKHNWYTQIQSDQHSICIYTVPYLTKTFEMKPNTIMHYHTDSHNINLFNRITKLTLTHQSITDKYSYNFPNVTSLTLVCSDVIIDSSFEPIDLIHCLKIMINLSKLKHLDISKYKSMISSEKLLELVKESSKLSSIKIDPAILISLYSNDELCEYLMKKINILNIYRYNHCSFNSFEEMIMFHTIFKNIEQIRCNINDGKQINFLLNQFPKLLVIHIYMSSTSNYRSVYSLLQQLSVRQKFNFHVKYDSLNVPELSIWKR